MIEKARLREKDIFQGGCQNSFSEVYRGPDAGFVFKDRTNLKHVSPRR